MFTPADWYWIVGGDESRYWSSAASAYVTYRPADAPTTRIANEAELADVLGHYGLAGPQPPTRYALYRSVFIERMEPAEAAVLEAALASAEPKLRLMFGSVEYFVSDDPLFAVLHWTVAVGLGSVEEPNFARADELLAP